MIKKDTLAHEVYLTLLGNPITRKELNKEVMKPSGHVTWAIRRLEQEGVEILQDGDLVWIDSKTKIQQITMRHDQLYLMLMSYTDGVSFRDACESIGIRGSRQNLMRVIRALESKYEVEVKEIKCGGQYKYLIPMQQSSTRPLNVRHDVMLSIINNPGKAAREISDLTGATIAFVYHCLRELNMSPGSKPPHYVG